MLKQVKPKVTEHQTQAAVLDYLAMKKIFAWRNNTGAMPIESAGGRRFIRFGTKGSPDIIGILPGGRFLGIEVKGPTGKLSEDQATFLGRINNAGGVGFWCNSIDMAIKLINKAL